MRLSRNKIAKLLKIGNQSRKNRQKYINSGLQHKRTAKANQVVNLRLKTLKGLHGKKIYKMKGGAISAGMSKRWLVFKSWVEGKIAEAKAAEAKAAEANPTYAFATPSDNLFSIDEFNKELLKVVSLPESEQIKEDDDKSFSVYIEKKKLGGAEAILLKTNYNDFYTLESVKDFKDNLETYVNNNKDITEGVSNPGYGVSKTGESIYADTATVEPKDQNKANTSTAAPTPLTTSSTDVVTLRFKNHTDKEVLKNISRTELNTYINIKGKIDVSLLSDLFSDVKPTPPTSDDAFYVLLYKDQVIVSGNEAELFKGTEKQKTITIYVRSKIYFFFQRVLYGNLFFLIDVQYIRNLVSFLARNEEYKELVSFRESTFGLDDDSVKVLQNENWNVEESYYEESTAESDAAATNADGATADNSGALTLYGGGGEWNKSRWFGKSKKLAGNKDTKYVGFPNPMYRPKLNKDDKKENSVKDSRKEEKNNFFNVISSKKEIVFPIEEPDHDLNSNETATNTYRTTAQKTLYEFIQTMGTKKTDNKIYN